MARWSFFVVAFLLAVRAGAAEQKTKAMNVAGLWLTDLGLMELTQEGEKVKGTYAIKGVSEIEGTVTGRKLEFEYKSFRNGKGSFEFAADGKRFTGTATGDGGGEPYKWNGRKAPEFARHAKLAAARIVDGSTKNLLTYSVRAPNAYKPGDAKRWPAIVILHGSNMNAKAYVNTLAAAWPQIARDYIIIGINGERPVDIGDDPKFNYTYVSFVGRSTFKGFPGTDRESPALVAEAMAELREVYPVKHYFVGGHSQGGFLTYSLLMNFPEVIAGAFPISAGVIFQCEPNAYAEEKVKVAQRAVPVAIIHGRQDAVVALSAGEYAATIFGEAGFPAMRFFIEEKGAGHRFGLLPVGEAVAWLEAQSSDDPAKLLDFAEQRTKARSYRDAIAAMNRARALDAKAAQKTRLDRLAKDIDAKAAPGAKEFLPKITDAKKNDWIDAFLIYRDEFEFAPAAREVMEAFTKLRAEHEAPAKKLMNEAQAAFQNNQRDEGYAKYREIVEKHYASSAYRNAKRWISERK